MMRKHDIAAAAGLGEGFQKAGYRLMSSANNQSTTEHSVVLYTRSGCHLCDEAQLVLEQHGLVPQCVDIDADARLRERFDTCVPVVEIDGQIRFRGRVEPVLLRRILHRRAD